PNPRTSSKSDLLLLSLGKLYPHPGARDEMSLDWDRDCSLACARDRDELKYHWRALLERKLVDSAHGRTITHAGWQRIEELATSPLTSKYAFVAMSFSPRMLALWPAAFQPAIEKAGFEARLANTPQHNHQIDAHIVTAIKGARFVVADVTE